MNAERSPAANANNCAKSAGFLTLTGFFLIARFSGSPRFSNASVLRVVHLCKMARRQQIYFAASVLSYSIFCASIARKAAVSGLERSFCKTAGSMPEGFGVSSVLTSGL